MKIGCVYGFDAYPPRGGNRLHAYQIIRGFQRLGHEVHTLGDDTVPDTTGYPIAATRDFLAAIDVLYVRVDGRRMSEVPGAIEAIKGASVPIVCEVNAPANENLAYAWLAGRPVPENPFARRLDRVRRWFGAMRAKPGIRVEERTRRRLMKRVSRCTVVAEPLARYLAQDLDFTDVTVLPNGSDHRLNHPDREAVGLPAETDGTLKVLYAGSLSYPWQGFPALFEAARLAHTRELGMSFLLLTNDQIPHDLPPNMHVLERVAYEDVAGYIRAVDVCVALHPEYTWSRWGFHGSPMKLFDYLACGRPVIATSVGQLNDLIPEMDCGLLVPLEGEAVVEALVRLQDDETERDRLGRNGRRAVEERYNWDAIAAETARLMIEAINDAGGTASSVEATR